MKKIKNLLFFCLIQLCVFLIFSFAVGAVDYSADAVLKGNCGDGSNVYWELVPNNDGTEEAPKYSMNIFGTGTTFKNIDNNGNRVGFGTFENAKWAEYIPDLTRVYIGDNIVSLDSASFVKNSAITTVELGASLKTIGTASFEGCKELKTIYRKGSEPIEGTYDLSGITTFGGYIFDGCSYVENIILPTDGSYSLPIEFLKGNQALKSISIPAACKSVATLAFRNCSALEKVYIEGDTVLNEGEVTKGVEGTFYAYAFHSCGNNNSFSISAKAGTNAASYAERNAKYTIGKSEYSISYIPPIELSVIYDGSEIGKLFAVKGFFCSSFFVSGNATYALFVDEECTSLYLADEELEENGVVYARKLIDAVGFMVRIKDYHGLRAIFEYNKTAFDGAVGFTVKNAGVISKSKNSFTSDFDLNTAGTSNIVVYEGSKLVGKLTEISKDNYARFSAVAVGFENEEGISVGRAVREFMFRGYVTIEDSEGNEITYYTPITSKSLLDAVVATEEKGADKLSSDAIAFLGSLSGMGIDKNYLYSKDEALAHLTAVYNDPDKLLSGQHISNYTRNCIEDNLKAIYENSGSLPAVLSLDTAVSYRSGNFNESNNIHVADQLQEYARLGGLVSLCAHLANPDPDADTSDGIYRGKLDTLEKWDQLFTEGNVIHDNFMEELSASADFMQLLEDRGVTVFWRPYHETNGAWFWFCGASVPTAGTANDVSAEYFVKLWKYTYKYFTEERGLGNLIWVYSPNIAKDNSNSSAYDVMKYYPGDDYCDVVGIDWYTGKNVSNNETPELLAKEYENVWSNLASTGKPVVYGEFGPGDGLRNPDPILSYNGADALLHVESVAATGRNMGWIVFWSGWQDNPISLLLMDKAGEFMNSNFVLDLFEARELIYDIHQRGEILGDNNVDFGQITN